MPCVLSVSDIRIQNEFKNSEKKRGVRDKGWTYPEPLGQKIAMGKKARIYLFFQNPRI